MEWMDLTFPTAAENLAGDEALLDECEERGGPEVLRFWEYSRHFVVLGHSNHITTEVDLGACAREGIPVFRRRSGGGTVLQGPGCLNYALVLRMSADPALGTITGTNGAILQRIASALRPLVEGHITIEGQSDLTIDGVKFSGNAQRRRLKTLLFHGTLLHGLDIALLERTLPIPARQPAYRNGRSHSNFLRNLPVESIRIKEALCEAWRTTEVYQHVPSERIQELIRKRYGVPEWIARL
jgi:lipoate-protein ligase A